MKTICITGDYPAWTYVGEIIDEMQTCSPRFAARHPELAAQKDSLEALLLEKFPQIDVDLSFCFRVLDRDSGWSSKVRMWKNDSPHSFNKINSIPESDRTLGFDMVVHREDFAAIKGDKTAQKRMLGNEMLRFVKLKLPNYTKKIPITKDEMNGILTTIEEWLARHEWL